ncbi:MAG: CPBP family intramembrane glutamic endopeptidase [Methylomonas sp.]
MIAAIRYALMPLVLLVVLACVASFISYGILLVIGDALPINKMISKATLVLLILSISPLSKYLNFSWKDLGFAPAKRFFSQLNQGLILSLATLLPVLVVLYGLDVHVWDDTRNWTIGKIASKVGVALFFALLIAVGEELLFRGMLLTSLRRKMHVVLAVIISAVYYSALHFLRSSSQIAYAELTPASGLQLVVEAFTNWLNPDIISAFTALLVVGLFLAVMRSRVRHSLGLCIGCHAGWVWQIKVSKDLFNLNSQSEFLYLVSSYDGVVGPFVSVWLLVAMLGLIYFRQR